MGAESGCREDKCSSPTVRLSFQIGAQSETHRIVTVTDDITEVTDRFGYGGAARKMQRREGWREDSSPLLSCVCSEKDSFLYFFFGPR